MASRDLYKRLQADMAEDGMFLQWLPVNQAYMVTFGSWDGPRVLGPCPLRVVVDWWDDLESREGAAQEVCYE